MKKLPALLATGAFVALVPLSAIAYETGQSAQTVANAAASSAQQPNILEAIRDNGGFSIFLAAVEHVDLTAALSSPRVQYTLYAPTDAAFAKMPKEQLAALFEDKHELRRIVAQHVVLGKYASADIQPGSKRSIWGDVLPVTTHRNLHVNWVKVVATDLESGNGIVHAVDNLLITPSEVAASDVQELTQPPSALSPSGGSTLSALMTKQ